MPAPDPVHGWAGREIVDWHARHATDAELEKAYGHRFGEILDQHPDHDLLATRINDLHGNSGPPNREEIAALIYESIRSKSPDVDEAWEELRESEDKADQLIVEGTLLAADNVIAALA